MDEYLMDKFLQTKISDCIDFLQLHGYKVIKNTQSNIGKWVTFNQEGMPCILHGRIIEERGDYYVVRCKNAQKRYVECSQVLGMFNTRAESYIERTSNG